MIRSKFLLAAALTLACQPLLDACTTFCVRAGDRVLFGRNYDFEIGDGRVMVNAARLEKKGALDGGPSWRSRYGSVTFNQFGRGYPMGGINEAGVVVELMWLDETQYPAADARLPVSVLEWIQYQLDTAGSVADILASDARVRIQGQIPLHYLVSDATGAAATIEFLGGRLVARSGDTLPAAVLANETYASSLAFADARRGQTPGGSGSHERFARVAAALPDIAAAGGASIERAFTALGDAAQRNTRWSIVYDQTARVIHWRTDEHDAVRFLRMASVDFSCVAAPLSLDVHAPVAGDARPHLTTLTLEANSELIAESSRKTSFTRGTSADEIASQARYGFSASCAS
ncbi:MAG: linear amide C-N hydrolase [Acidobacteriota bacterium]|nr:linear amide C-N hydrolase [Acidobacteriota bacterium]